MSSRGPGGGGRGGVRGRGRGGGGRGGRGGGGLGGRPRPQSSYTGQQQHHQPRDSGYSAHRTPRHDDGQYSSAAQPWGGSGGAFACDYIDPSHAASNTAEPAAGDAVTTTATEAPGRCRFSCSSQLALMLHKADRHLIYPEGGIEELRKRDPMLIAEEREKQRRNRGRGRGRGQQTSARPGSLSAAHRKRRGSDDEHGNEEGDENDDGDDEVDDDEGPSDRALDGPPDATIAGLNIQLNTPELIAEWISQRKKRWPTRVNVEQKTREAEERRKRSELIYGERAFGRKRPMPPFPQQQQSERDEKRPRIEDTAISKPAAASAGDSNTKVEAPQGDASDSDSSGPPSEAGVKTVPQSKAVASASDDSSSSSDSSSEDSSDDDDGDDDDAPQELSSKAPAALTTHPVVEADRRPVCRHWLQGRCSYGDQCRKRHEKPEAAVRESRPADSVKERPQRRPQPRAPPPNPFAQPDLLHQLLRNEIAKHVDSVAQAIRFIVDNDMLLHVEREDGLAEEQRKRRGLIQEVGRSVDGPATADGTSAASEGEGGLAEPQLEQPLLQGGLPVLPAASGDAAASAGPSTLYRPSSPLLRPLSSLKYPPEPDPLIYLDPLRRDDPKPLLPSQLVSIATDASIRSILTPSSALYPAGEKAKGLERALVSLDALPSDAYRNAAIEMILGVSDQTPMWGHESIGRSAMSHHHRSSNGGLTTTLGGGGRRVTETDLFRLGLRVGHVEVGQLRALADCISRIVQGPEAALDTVDAAGIDGIEMALLDPQQRDEARRRYWQREGEREERLRKLGIDI